MVPSGQSIAIPESVGVAGIILVRVNRLALALTSSSQRRFSRVNSVINLVDGGIEPLRLAVASALTLAGAEVMVRRREPPFVELAWRSANHRRAGR